MASVHHPSPNMHLMQMHHTGDFPGVSPFELVGHLTPAESGLPSLVVAGQAGGVAGPNATSLKDLYLESGSALSDVDFESDDVSFDDSASDQSDGSDSGHYNCTSHFLLLVPWH
jgi:hypothetical protein